MGRTILPVRAEVEAQLAELRRFFKALGREDREAFLRLYADVKAHLSAITYSNPLNPSELMQWSALLGLTKRMEKLRREIDRCVSGRG